VTHWHCLDGHSKLIDNFFEKLPAVAVVFSGFLKFLHDIGERSLPNAFLLLERKLRAGTASKILSDSSWLFNGVPHERRFCNAGQFTYPYPSPGLNQRHMNFSPNETTFFASITRFIIDRYPEINQKQWRTVSDTGSRFLDFVFRYRRFRSQTANAMIWPMDGASGANRRTEPPKLCRHNRVVKIDVLD